MSLTEHTSGPIVIGGLGGSGTRVVAQILNEAGVYIGDELNESLDNLWFTLLFRRPTIQNPDDERLLPLMEIFNKRMRGNHKWSLREQLMLWSCALEFMKNSYVRSERFGFPIRTLRSFYRHNVDHQKVWGWKEPNAHVFLLLLMRYFPTLRYVHVLRHPLDAVFGNNKIQLKNWKHVFHVTEHNEQRAMLLFHQAVNSRAIELGKQLGDRFLLIKHEDLCTNSNKWTKQILYFANVEVDAPTFEQLTRIPDSEKSKPRYNNRKFDELMPLAQQVANEFGYSIHETVKS